MQTTNGKNSQEETHGIKTKFDCNQTKQASFLVITDSVQTQLFFVSDMIININCTFISMYLNVNIISIMYYTSTQLTTVQQ